MNKRMKRRKILGLTIYGLILISIIATNDITYLKFVGILAIALLIGDTLMNKL